MSLLKVVCQVPRKVVDLKDLLVSGYTPTHELMLKVEKGPWENDFHVRSLNASLSVFVSCSCSEYSVHVSCLKLKLSHEIGKNTELGHGLDRIVD